jgi:hypothetical protein
LTVIPYQRWDDDRGGPPPSGALILSVTEDGIRKTGVVSHGDADGNPWMPIRRSLLIGHTLVTVSDAGIMLSDPESLETLDWASLG